MELKIATLNLCLGLRTKKEEVKKLILENQVDICCLQETDIEQSFPLNILSFSGYNYEGESNTKKARAGTYIRDNLSYFRRSDLEGVDSHLVIVDLLTKLYL